MFFFKEREKQCRFCCNECGYDEPREKLEDGTVLYEHVYDCILGYDCSVDSYCSDYTEEK